MKALATISRITASFPAAFPPAAVPAEGAPGSLSAGAAGLLREWGQLEADRSRWFIDGGVLNNKPFSTTVRDIYLRTGERRVKRKLFYVDPDPERFGQPRDAVEPASPTSSSPRSSASRLPEHHGDVRGSMSTMPASDATGSSSGYCVPSG